MSGSRRHEEATISGIAQAPFPRGSAAPLPLAQEVDKILNLDQLIGGQVMQLLQERFGTTR
jgi:hypothetical protein